MHATAGRQPDGPGKLSTNILIYHPAGLLDTNGFLQAYANYLAVVSPGRVKGHMIQEKGI